MVSLPPMNPNSGSHVEPEASPQSPKLGGPKPESVRFMLQCWAVMIGGELLHQLLTVASVVIDPSALKESAKQAAKAQGEDVSDAAMNAGMWGTVIVAALIQLAVLVAFVVALNAVNKQKKWSPGAVRLLQIFAIFFALRALALFMMHPSSSGVPVALSAFDGAIQIMLAVAGGMGVFYSSQKESRDYVQHAAGANRGGGQQ